MLKVGDLFCVDGDAALYKVHEIRDVKGKKTVTGFTLTKHFEITVLAVDAIPVNMPEASQ